jgi:hypothetical protein
MSIFHKCTFTVCFLNLEDDDDDEDSSLVMIVVVMILLGDA